VAHRGGVGRWSGHTSPVAHRDSALKRLSAVPATRIHVTLSLTGSGCTTRLGIIAPPLGQGVFGCTLARHRLRSLFISTSSSNRLQGLAGSLRRRARSLAPRLRAHYPRPGRCLDCPAGLSESPAAAAAQSGPSRASPSPDTMALLRGGGPATACDGGAGGSGRRRRRRPWGRRVFKLIRVSLHLVCPVLSVTVRLPS
jgi:hypothetical protein